MNTIAFRRVTSSDPFDRLGDRVHILIDGHSLASQREGPLQIMHDVCPLLVTARIPEGDQTPNEAADIILSNGLLIDEDHTAVRLAKNSPQS